MFIFRLSLSSFFDKYELIRNIGTEFQTDLPFKLRACRFCKRNEKDTTFKNRSHLLPELLGQNNYISFDECDDCNSIFSKFENHLATFTRPYLTVMGTKTKSKIPTFQSRSINGKNETRTLFKVDKDGNRNLTIGNREDIRSNEDGSFSIRFRKPGYRPDDVFKTLLKIGLSILPEQYLSDYENSINWILNKPATVNRIQCVWITILTTARFNKPDLFLYKKRYKESQKMSDFTMIICTANLVFQFSFPYPDNHSMPEGLSPEVELFPAFAYEKDIRNSTTVTNVRDLRGRNVIEEDEWLTFTSATHPNILK